MKSFTLTFTTLFTASLALVGCGDGPISSVTETDELAFAAPDYAGSETGDAGSDDGFDSASDGPDFGASDEGGGEEGGEHETGDAFDPNGDGSATGGGGPLPEAGFCMDGDTVVGVCATGEALALDCTPAYIATCENLGLTFEGSTVPEVSEYGYDCDNLNDAIADCTDQWFTDCVNNGGYLDCINEDEEGGCIEASCEDTPIPG